MKKLEPLYIRLFAKDVEYLKEISDAHGDFAHHVRKAVQEYVKNIKGE